MARNSSSRQDGVPQVIISVSGGVAEAMLKPKGIAVTIFDYDVEGEGRATKDPDGRECRISEWPASEQVVGNEHWPIIKTAPRDIVSPDTRRWKCPDCGKVIDHSYEALADVGIPICGDCDLDMELI